MSAKPKKSSETLVEVSGVDADFLTVYTEDQDVVAALNEFGLYQPTGPNRYYLSVDHRYRVPEVALYLASLKPGGEVRDLSTYGSAA